MNYQQHPLKNKCFITRSLFVLFFMLAGFAAQSQTIEISGKITDSATLQGLELASVLSNGRTIGVSANDGTFKVKAAVGSTLTFSYQGYKTVKQIATSGFMTVTMSKNDFDNQSRDVVVTALGIKKERKALGYSVSELSDSELMKNKNTDIVNSLAGKAPGVNVTQFSGAAGAGASITIRGGNSTSDSRQNSPLFVVDGIIYDNTTNIPGNTATDGMSRSNTTYSNRVMDINPEDIQTLSILKGAAAAALYGSRAGDGVIRVDANSRIMTSWADKEPQAQTEFGNGSYSSNGVLATNTYSSWGLPIPADSTIYNNIKNFFQHGIIYDNNVNVSGGTKNGSFYLSGSNFDQTGIVPGTDYDKTTFRFNGEQKYGNLTLDANVAYSVANTKRTLTTAGLYNGGGNGAMGAVYNWPVTLNMKNYINSDGSEYRPFAGTIPLEDDIDNPYWIINEDKLSSLTSRFTGGINLNYKITSWWDVIARLGYDQYTTQDYTYIAPGSAVSLMYENGRLSKDVLSYTFITTNEMTNIHKTFGNFDAHILLGTTTEDTKILGQTYYGYSFITAGTISFANIAQTNEFFTDATTRSRLMGIYGEAGVSYKDIAYLTLTDRNDQTSTLPVQNNSYFYPSVSGSFIFTSLLPKNNILSFGKIRGSWAQVGKGANPYATLTYTTTPISYGSFTGVGNGYTSGNPNLVPEIQTSWEVGAELKFFNNRLGLDYTYYDTRTKNQIAQPRLSNASGYILTSINSGSVINKGMEIALNGKLIEQRDFSWDATLNFSYNKGRLGQFLPGVSYFYPTDAQFGTVKAASIPNGGYFLGMTGLRPPRQTDANGNEIPNGQFQVDTTTGLYKTNTTQYIVGNREPDWIAGFNNTLRYKKFILSFLLDIRKGGAVFDGTDQYMVSNGLSKTTLQNNRQSVTVTGVNSQTGAPFSQTYNANQSYTISGVTYAGTYMIQQYWQNYANNSLNFITNVNWLKLRSLQLTYDFTDMLKNQKVIKRLSASITGNNLFTWTNYKGMDPEVSAAGGTGGSGSTGIDYLGIPAVASFAFGVNLSF